MANHELLTDDYVAELLAKDAQDCSLKYSAMGMEAFRSNKKPANLPKPNTRFLRHIIKDTDTHNKALLAKEAAESKARLEDLEHSEEVKRLKSNPNTHDIRRRQLGDIHAILGGKRRRRTEDGESSSGSRDSRRHRSGASGESSHKTQSKDLIKDRHDDRRQHGRLDDDYDNHGDRTRRESGRPRRRERDRDSGSDDEGHRHSRRRRHRSRSPDYRRRSRSRERRKHRHRSRSPLVRDTSTKRQGKSPQRDSDSADELVGPMPAPQPRGRGALAGSSGIDHRFSETYDPKTDVQMDEEEGGDWDNALEAFRDRQKLKQNQEARLRSAGFGEAQIQKLQAGGEKLAEDVRWSQAGEKRVWDRGKEDDFDINP
ncbi:unnamed protein product [Clonostachys rhizophaga]|uniref:Pre-mRNA-splicing factor 38B n=1 Tax=Clonostachys rhizophaga TaxID=160324 RepID=A0A9N9V4D4_9HYPO|nr:unnamed protein product [Clonostachys rhizophaga]